MVIIVILKQRRYTSISLTSKKLPHVVIILYQVFAKHYSHGRCWWVLVLTQLCRAIAFNKGCTSGLLVNVLACIRKVASSSPTRCRLFSPMSTLSSTLKMRRCSSPHPLEGMSVLGNWLILATYAIPVSLLATFDL